MFGVGGLYEQMFAEQVFDSGGEHPYDRAMTQPTAATPAAHTQLTARQRGILDFIVQNMRDRGYPPSVREIGEAVGLSSSATVHNHLGILQKLGYLHRDFLTAGAGEHDQDRSILHTRHAA